MWASAQRDGRPVRNAAGNKQKINVFGCPGGGRNPSPNKLRLMIEGLEHVLAPLKLLGSDA